mmetsp:Transcript_80927/g.203604  ORF Transcript_80927/g.203604 Transcript_80927/m.203604 type:complete len:120 (-) Transcript_80927:1243-1602(-)
MFITLLGNDVPEACLWEPYMKTIAATMPESTMYAIGPATLPRYCKDKKLAAPEMMMQILQMPPTQAAMTAVIALLREVCKNDVDASVDTRANMLGNTHTQQAMPRPTVPIATIDAPDFQ